MNSLLIKIKQQNTFFVFVPQVNEHAQATSIVNL